LTADAEMQKYRMSQATFSWNMQGNSTTITQPKYPNGRTAHSSLSLWVWELGVAMRDPME